MGKTRLQLLAILVGALTVCPALGGAASAAAASGSLSQLPPPPLDSSAGGVPLQSLPAPDVDSPAAGPLTPEFASVEASSPAEVIQMVTAHSRPVAPDEVETRSAGPFGPVPLADTDNNDINDARWVNGSSSWTGETVDGRNVGGFQRADIDWWKFPMTNVSAGTADVFEFDVQKEAGEQLYAEIRAYPTFDFDNYQQPSTYHTLAWDSMNASQDWGVNSHFTLTAFEENIYFLYIRSPLRNGCCMVNYSILNVTDYLLLDSSIDDNSNRTSADVFQPSALPVGQELEQNADYVDVFDLTAQIVITPANGDSSRVTLGASVTGGRTGMSDFYNTSQMPAVTSEGDTLSVAALILFYPDVRGIWHIYQDAAIAGQTLSLTGVVNGTPIYAALYVYSLINAPVAPTPLSGIPGWVSYDFTSFSHLDDRAPVFIPSVPGAAMWEDDTPSGQNLLNLSPYFTDDRDVGFLRFGLRYNQFPLIISTSVTGDWLSVSVLTPNWWGNVTLQALGIDRGLDGIANTADDHATSSNFFAVNVRPVNDPPSITDIGGRTNTGAVIEFKMAQGTSLTITPTVADDDGLGGFSFSLDSTPSFATFVSGTGAITVQPGNFDVGLHPLTETVSDGAGAQATVRVLFNVSNINDEPRFVRVGGVNISDFPHTFTATQGELFSLVLEVGDIDWEVGYLDNINFAADRTFITVVRHPVDFRLATASFTPTNAQVGLITAVFSVTDGALGAFDDNVTVPIVVQNANDAPFFVSVGTVQGVYPIDASHQVNFTGQYNGARQGRPFAMTVRADDIDVSAGHGDSLAFSTSLPGKFRVTLNSDGVSADLTFTADQTDAARGHVLVDILVTDSGNPPYSDTITAWIDIEDVNDPPAWTPVFSVNLTEGVEFAYTFRAVDPDGDPLWYTTDAADFSIDPETGDVLFTPTNELIRGADLNIDVTFTARDTKNAISTTVVHFFIRNVNSPPSGVRVIAPIEASSFGPGEAISFRGAGTDDDAGDAGGLEFLWLVDGEEVGRGQTTLITLANPGEAPRTVTVTLRVVDPHNASATAEVLITINGSPAPPKSPGFEAVFALAGVAAAAAISAALVRRRK